MSSRLAFQTQLASIMEVLANAAVAEICKLVDDDYAVVSVQMSQCQRENKALKRKLNVLELKMARGSAERRLHNSTMNSRPNSRVHVNTSVNDKFRGSPSAGSVFDRQLDMGLWPGGSAASSNQNSTPIQPACIREEPAGIQLVEQESQLVKEERMDNSLADVRDIPLIGEDGVVECGPRGGGRASALPASTQSTEQLIHQQQGPRSRQQGSGLEVSGSETLPKSEQVEGTPQHLGPPGLLAHPDSEFDMFERASELGAFFDDAESEAEGSRPSCSYSGVGAARAGDSAGGGAAFHSEQRQLPRSPGDDRRLSRKQVVIDIDSEEGEEPLGWEDEGGSGQSRLQVNPGNMSQPRNLTSVDIALPSTSNVNGWGHGGGASRGGKAPHRTSAREKLFICNFCGKAFNRPKKVEIHQRTHTGEKPFRCNTCGKMFSEAGNLKKHQRVHTGEKPYNCQLCGKGFAWIRNLKTHQEKSHPDVFPEGEMTCFS